MAQAGDLVRDWAAPDGRRVRVVVQSPRVPAAPVTVVLPTVPAEQDARPYFEAALAQVRATKASRLVVPPGRYVFRTTVQTPSTAPAPVTGHLLLQDQDDLTIDGAGATLVFMQDAHGLIVRGSRRLKLSKLTLDYGLRTASLGTVVSEGSAKRVRIDSRFPVTAANAVHYVMERDAATGLWPAGAPRAILPPDSATPAVYVGNQTYASSAFSALTVGKQVVVLHQYYGGTALRIDDTPQARQAEDITLDGLTVHSAPGMGIVAYGLKRGLAILNSRIVPRADGSNPVSTSYDAVHVIQSGGDVVINGNTIAGQGDDAINLNSPIHPSVRIDAGAGSLVLGKYSRFISAGDTLAFFDDQARYLGQRRVAVKPTALGGLDYRVSLDAPLDAAWNVSVARDLSLLGSRYVVANNVIERCHCHGLLAQWPNGLVERNTFRDLSANAIRLLTDVGTWNEGVGAINVIVHHNTITRSGADLSATVPSWGAITAYGGTAGGQLATSAVNRHLRISNNTIEQSQQGCITVASSQSVVVNDNRCIDTNLRNPGTPSVVVTSSTSVRLFNNTRSGSSTGAQTVAPTSSNVTAQVGY
ncbi:right-handed parallel beta-helix repeat-containing protein [Azohydromonas caseinilytica]|uniref:Right-handed parallel beta-helix repeat-containing protein n=1 Tax=Azohydromonas caseinilytica TaxID=2728836 RepID=A0A848FHL7_9BURK|nr:right-handed parallel beta-helix repeat-containing protein [Azohydromonas caseinilytica]NML17779.1 right-handed parallel beta-helix repeat-containing protein [Azohydromonas caseinilytica]